MVIAVLQVAIRSNVVLTLNAFSGVFLESADNGSRSSLRSPVGKVEVPVPCLQIKWHSQLLFQFVPILCSSCLRSY